MFYIKIVLGSFSHGIFLRVQICMTFFLFPKWLSSIVRTTNFFLSSIVKY
jgi:hypothetical protein